MGKAKSPQSLAKLITYILGRRPDEFGLVPDPDGFVKIKDLLKALSEEEGWKYVRRSHLDEILYSLPDPPFELLDKKIRAKGRDQLSLPEPAQDLPKLLFTCIRKRAYRTVSEKGIFPLGYQQVVLSSDQEQAVRIGKRVDPDPVILTIQVQKSIAKGVRFFQTGELLYLAESIPTGCFSGPPLPKERPEAKKTDDTDETRRPKMAGTYPINLADTERNSPAGSKSKTRKMHWKDNKKRIKKQKRKRERPPWRR